MTNMTDLISAADSLASKNLQWFLVFTLLLFGIGIFFSVRWLVNKLEMIMSQQRSDQQSYTTALLAINSEFARVVEKNTAAVTVNTVMTERCNEALKRIT